MRQAILVVVVALSMAVLATAPELFDGIDYINNMTKLAIIGSCVGMFGGLRGPEFACDSFCKDFNMTLEKVWLDGEYLTSGFLGVDHENETIVLMHRGTMTLANLVLDFDNEQVPLVLADKENTLPDCDGCRVHQGFYRGYNSSFAEIAPEIDRLVEKYPGYPLLLGGHSMGGSVAMITAAHLKSKGYKNVKLVTCGQPMTGDKNFADWVDSLFDTTLDIFHRDMYILVREHDPVPFYPASDNYCPTSGEIFIVKDRPLGSLEPETHYYLCHGQRDPECSWGGRDGAEFTVPGLPFTHPDYGPGVYSSCVAFTSSMLMNSGLVKQTQGYLDAFGAKLQHVLHHFI